MRMTNYLAIYEDRTANRVSLPICKDDFGSCRIVVDGTLRPIRWLVDDLEFKGYRMVEGKFDQFMKYIVVPPAKKVRGHVNAKD